MARSVDKILADQVETQRRLGELIRELRENQGLSQAEVARTLNVSRQAVSMWEKGLNEPSPRHSNALFELLGAKTSARASAEEGMASPLLLRPSSVNDIPIFQVERVVGSEELFTIEDEASHWYPRPDSLEAGRAVLCFQLPGSTMIPWRLPGDPVFVELQSTPRIGDHCLVTRRDGSQFVRLMTGFNAETVRLKAYLSDSEELVPRSSLRELWRVLEWSELFGPFVKVWRSSLVS